jgi:uncharacterized membrane protein YeiB
VTAPLTRRLDGLDAARGLAVVSMLVAHLCPVGGPFTLSEYLTAPLFALVVGVSMGLVLRERRPRPADFLRDQTQRGLVLVVLGLALQPMYHQIDVVLPYLGLLVVVLAPLALLLHRLPATAVAPTTLGLAAVIAVAGPAATTWARDVLIDHLATWPSWWLDVLRWLAAGGSYRLVSFLPMALGGLALAGVLRRATRPAIGPPVVAVLAVASAASYLVGRRTPTGSAPYSGTTAEVVGATLLAAAAVVAAFLVLHVAQRLRASAALAPLLSTGRLALTAYTLQVLVLVALSAARGHARDDSWLVLATTTVAVVGGCWLLERWLGTGPLEWLLRRLRPTDDRAASERSPEASPVVSGRSGVSP